MNPRHPYNSGFLAESSYGPVVRETRLEAVQRRARYAGAHPLRSCVTGHCNRQRGHGGRHRFVTAGAL